MEERPFPLQLLPLNGPNRDNSSPGKGEELSGVSQRKGFGEQEGSDGEEWSFDDEDGDLSCEPHSDIAVIYCRYFRNSHESFNSLSDLPESIN